MRTFSFENWTVDILVDNDGHLNVYIKAHDETAVSETETGIRCDANDEIHLRFTTEKIEDLNPEKIQGMQITHHTPDYIEACVPDGMTRTKIVQVEFEDIGEGVSGNYDPNDPDDIALLRFYVRTNDPENTYDPEGLSDVDDASYCTQMPVDADPEIRKAALLRLMEAFFEPVVNGDSVKKIGERMSWISPDWFQEDLP